MDLYPSSEDCIAEILKSLNLIASSLRVTEENLLFETPTLFVLNVFTLEGTHFYSFIISERLSFSVTIICDSMVKHVHSIRHTTIQCFPRVAFWSVVY